MSSGKCRLGISRPGAIAADNRDRQRQGLAIIRTKVVLHTGPVLVGNIGQGDWKSAPAPKYRYL